MDDSKEQRLASTASSDHRGVSQNPTVPRTRMKRWHFKSLIVVVSLGVFVVVVCLLRSVLVRNYFGLGVALCFVTCGLFLVRHLIRLLLEEDKLQDPQIKENEATIAPPDANALGQETDYTSRAADTEQNIKQRN